MDILVSGSLAYDRIMSFGGNFSDHIMPEKTHVINISFMVDRMVENFGGTAGNIAFALAMLGKQSRIRATIGRDHDLYFRWMEKHGISTSSILVVEDELTASAFITTDQADNQITGFNPGAMKFSSGEDLVGVDPRDAIAIISPGNGDDMVGYAETYRDMGLPFIFDPGQAIPALSAAQLLSGIRGSRLLIANDYEIEMILRKLETELADLLALTESIVTTRGEHGAVISELDGENSIPAVPLAEAVDPTGAGDAFRAGLIKGLIEGKDMVTCAEMGTVAAAFAVEVYGTQTYSYTEEEFKTRYEQHFGPLY